MTKTILVAKAQECPGGDAVETIVIIADRSLSASSTPGVLEIEMEQDAQSIADGLIEHLPSGTLARLIAELMRRYANNNVYRGPMAPRREG